MPWEAKGVKPLDASTGFNKPLTIINTGDPEPGLNSPIKREWSNALWEVGQMPYEQHN